MLIKYLIIHLFDIFKKSVLTFMSVAKCKRWKHAWYSNWWLTGIHKRKPAEIGTEIKLKGHKWGTGKLTLLKICNFLHFSHVLISASEDMDVDKPVNPSPYVDRRIIPVSEVWVLLNMPSVINFIIKLSVMDIDEWLLQHFTFKALMDDFKREFCPWVMRSLESCSTSTTTTEWADW